MKQYYSVRTGKNKNFSSFSLDTLKKLFSDLYSELYNKNYFQECFGYDCVDAGFVAGSLGENIEAQIYRALRKDNLWPLKDKIVGYSEDDLFDVIEFLFDHVSKPLDGYNHEYNACGWHYSKFDKLTGQKEFAAKLNEILPEYSLGFEISSEGLILVKEENGLSSIHKADIPTENDEIKKKINLSIEKYLESRSNIEMRRIAIRELADILESLKSEIKSCLHSKDDSDLFNITNNFAIRHANDRQKIKYDRNIWYSWMFYFYLATIHALLRIKKRKKKT